MYGGGFGYGMGAPGYGAPGYGMPPMGSRGVGVDVNGDGVADYRVNPGVGVDVNGDGIADYRTGPTVSPGPGAFMPPGGYGYGY